MNGTITKGTSKGKIVYDIRYRYTDLMTGKIKQTTKRGFNRKKDAEAFLLDIQKEQHKIEEHSKESLSSLYAKTTVGNYLNEWFYEVKKSDRSIRTIEGYGYNILYMLPYIGNIRLGKLEAKHINEMYKTLRISGKTRNNKGLSENSVLYIHRTLSKALNDALRSGKIQNNILDRVDSPKRKRSHRPILDSIQMAELFRIINGEVCEVPFKIIAMLGLRRGEMMAITWDKINFAQKQLTIDEQIVCTDSGLVRKSTKDESDRVIALPNELLKLLNQHKTNQQKNIEIYGKKYEDNNLVFCKADGTPFNPRYLTTSFNEILKTNGFPAMHLHDLRHFAASQMLSIGTPMHVVSKILGHSSISITIDTYSHLVDSDRTNAADLMDKLYRSYDVKEFPSLYAI